MWLVPPQECLINSVVLRPRKQVMETPFAGRSMYIQGFTDCIQALGTVVRTSVL